MEKEIIMSGGSINRAVRIGDTVHRAVKGHPMLHPYLLYLEEAGMPGVPRFRGIDGQGREILTYLPGKTMGPDYPSYHPCLHSDGALRDMARFMRRLHDISAGFLPEAIKNSWTNPYFPHEKYETICHGDANIWNFVFVEDKLSGIFDFDQAHPGTRVWDLTSTLFSAVGLTYFVSVPELGTTVDYEASKHAADRARRIRLFFDAYGMACPSNLPELLVLRLQSVCDEIESGASKGDENYIRMVKTGGLTHYQKITAHLEEHGHEWV